MVLHVAEPVPSGLRFKLCLAASCCFPTVCDRIRPVALYRGHHDLREIFTATTCYDLSVESNP